jgi:hypothetical protein
MSYGTGFTCPRVVLALLAAAVVAMAGCGRPFPPALASGAVGVSPLDPSDIVRQRNDSGRGHVWILGSRGVSLYRAGKLVEVTLPSWQWVDPAYACPPDLAVGPGGEAIVTSNVVPVLWRIDPRTLAVSVHQLVLDADTDKDIGFSGLVYSAQQGAFFAANETHGSVWRIDPSLRGGRKIARTEPARGACGVTVPRTH